MISATEMLEGSGACSPRKLMQDARLMQSGAFLMHYFDRLSFKKYHYLL